MILMMSNCSHDFPYNSLSLPSIISTKNLIIVQSSFL